MRSAIAAIVLAAVSGQDLFLAPHPSPGSGDYTDLRRSLSATDQVNSNQTPSPAPQGSMSTPDDIARDVGDVTPTIVPLLGENGEVAKECSDLPRAASYHIHIMFWQSNQNNTAGALELRSRFIERFNLTERKCTRNHEKSSGLAVGLSFCAFELHYAPAGPFLTAQYSFFVPVGHYEEATRWMAQHRGQYSMMVHPNTGCVVKDHSDWAVWGGVTLPLDLEKDRHEAGCSRPGFMVDFSDEANICPSVHGHM